MAGTPLISETYWQTLQITRQDIESIHNHLFELETPLTTSELAAILVDSRIHLERESERERHQADGKTYLPKGLYKIGDQLVFPALNWQRGSVSRVRPGINPACGQFDVMTVSMADGDKMFAARLPEHRLNVEPVSQADDDSLDMESILQAYGQEIAQGLEAALAADDNLVRIAGRWFPRALLISVNAGHLNLAEAVLDMAGGEPRLTSNLLKDVSLPEGINPKLAEFSLNLALQEDGRFDEVGPAGEVLWCLRRLEPEGVQQVPSYLRYTPIDHDRSMLTPEMLSLESQLDDELSPFEKPAAMGQPAPVTVSLIYPHLRAGTLPLSLRTRALFPTAYESPRVRFTLVDGKSGLRMPAWVVRNEGYVFGLREWFKSHELMPGSLVEIRRGLKPGEVIVQAKTQRSTKDWVRTLMVGADGGMVFAMLKQPITAEFNDRMAIYVPDFDLLDPLWSRKQSFEELVIGMTRELTKLTPQGHVHAQELYSAVNLQRRVPPADLFALLSSHPAFLHVGDLHFRLNEGGA
jgi:hypothetical protein